MRRAIGRAALVAAVALATGLTACGPTRLRLESPRAEVFETRNVVYRHGSANPKHRLDVYAPEDAKDAPVVHFVHGGYWVGGDKDYLRFVTGLYGSVGEAPASRGVVTVVQSYRLVPETTIDGVVDDVMTGLRWTEEHALDYGGDPARIFMMGHSAGGHLTALAGTDDTLHTSRGMSPDAVRGYIVISGVWDVADMAATQDAAFQARVTDRVFGRDPSIWLAYSPIAKIGGRPARRFLVMAGEHDYPYLIPQARRAFGKLGETGAQPAFYLAEGNDHDDMVLAFGAVNDDMSAPVLDFIAR